MADVLSATNNSDTHAQPRGCVLPADRPNARLARTCTSRTHATHKSPTYTQTHACTHIQQRMQTHTHMRAKTQTQALKPNGTGKGTCTGCLEFLSGRQTVSNGKTARRLYCRVKQPGEKKFWGGSDEDKLA